MHKPLVLCFLLLVSLWANSQWAWKNPTPQGNDLFSISFINQDTGFVGGSVATLMKTTDGGATWDTKHLPGSRKYTRIEAISAPQGNVVYAIDGDRYAFKSTDLGETWDTIFHEYDESMWDMFFTDSLHGCIICDVDKILRTDDGGSSWQISNCPISGSLMSIWFVNHDTGFIMCGDGTLLKTIDGGTDWLSVYTMPTTLWSSIRFVSDLQGIAIGNHRIARTFNGGQSWLFTEFNEFYHINNVCYFNKDTLLIIGQMLYDPVVQCLSSFDAGNTWDTIVLQGPFATRGLIGFASGTAYVVGYTGLMARSNDFGYTWEYITNFLSSNFYNYGFQDIDFPSENVGYIVAKNGGLMLKTINGGLSWYELDTMFIMEGFKTIKFATEDQGAIGGSSIITTMDGGERWVKRLSLPFGDRIQSIDFATPHTGIAVGDQGNFYRTTDYGQCWSAVSNVPLIDYYKVCFASKDIGYAAGYKMLLKTTDAGITWQEIPLNFKPNSIDFITTEIGYMVGDNGLLKKTTNGGLNWITIQLPTDDPLLAVDFYDEQIGYVAGGIHSITSIILKTTDGGLTWTDEYIPTMYPITDICFSSSTKAYACAWSQFLFENVNAGGITGQNNNAEDHAIKVSLSPNPSSQTPYLNITISHQTNLKVEVYSSNGCLLQTIRLGEHLPGEYSFPINIANLGQGIYYYRVVTPTQALSKKLIVIRP